MNTDPSRRCSSCAWSISERPNRTRLAGGRRSQNSHSPMQSRLCFFFLMIRPPPRSTLSLHDALPIFALNVEVAPKWFWSCDPEGTSPKKETDRKSTRLNSSHVEISYTVFCLKKK